MIEVRLLGDLQRHVRGQSGCSGTVIRLASQEGRTVGQVLAHFGIDPEEVGHVFINGRLLPRSAYPITLGYPLAGNHPLTTEATLDIALSSGDRLGVFPQTMSLVVI